MLQVSTDLVPSGMGGGMEILPTRQARAVGRQLARMSASTDLRVRGIENESDVQASKVDVVRYLDHVKVVGSLEHVTLLSPWIGEGLDRGCPCFGSGPSGS